MLLRIYGINEDSEDIVPLTHLALLTWLAKVHISALRPSTRMRT